MPSTWKDPVTGIPVLSPGGTVFDITNLPAPNEPDGEPTHVVCCDPSTALCGADTVGQSIKAVHPGSKAAEGRPCSACLSLDGFGARCADPKCPEIGPEAP